MSLVTVTLPDGTDVLAGDQRLPDAPPPDGGAVGYIFPGRSFSTERTPWADKPTRLAPTLTPLAYRDRAMAVKVMRLFPGTRIHRPALSLYWYIATSPTPLEEATNDTERERCLFEAGVTMESAGKRLGVALAHIADDTRRVAPIKWHSCPECAEALGSAPAPEPPQADGDAPCRTCGAPGHTLDGAERCRSRELQAWAIDAFEWLTSVYGARPELRAALEPLLTRGRGLRLHTDERPAVRRQAGVVCCAYEDCRGDHAPGEHP